MPIGSRAFWLPRRGHGPAEYEDALAIDDRAGRYAVADGASEGCFTDLWARLLVIPFDQSFLGREDRDLEDRLRVELPGVLSSSAGAIAPITLMTNGCFVKRLSKATRLPRPAPISSRHWRRVSTL